MAITSILEWKEKVRLQMAILPEDLEPLLRAIQALELMWRSEINVSYASNIPGYTEKATRKDVLRELAISNGNPFTAQASLSQSLERKASTKAAQQTARALAAFQAAMKNTDTTTPTKHNPPSNKPAIPSKKEPGVN